MLKLFTFLLFNLLFLSGCGGKNPNDTQNIQKHDEQQLSDNSEPNKTPHMKSIWKPGDLITDLDLDRIKTLSNEEIQSIPEKDISLLTIEQIQKFSREQYLTFTVEQIARLTAAQFLKRDPVDLNCMSGEQFAALEIHHIRAFTYYHCSLIATKHLKHMRQDQIDALMEVDPTLFEAISADNLRGFSKKEIQSLEQERLNFLLRIYIKAPSYSDEFLEKLSLQQITSIEIKWIQKLTRYTLIRLSIEQLRAFTPEQVANLEQSTRTYYNERLGINYKSEEHPNFDFNDFFQSPINPAKKAFCDLLGLPENSSHEAIMRSYRRATFLIHPDRNQSPEAAKKIRVLNSLKADYFEARA